MTGTPPPGTVDRWFVAEDDEGPLFTAAELGDAVRHGFVGTAAPDELAALWTEHEPDHPGSSWTENLGLLVALVHPHRAERIRGVLGYTPAAFAAQLDAVRASLPWRADADDDV